MQIVRAVAAKATTNLFIQEVASMYNAMQMGMNVDYNDVSTMHMHALEYYAQEVNRKTEREMRMRKK